MRIGMAYFEFGGSKGVARAAAELATRMAANGHEVHFHCAQHPPAAAGMKVRFHKLKAVNSFNILGLASFAVLGRRSLVSGRYDVTHSYGNIVGADVLVAQSCHKAALEVARSARRSVKANRNFGIADQFRLSLEKRNFGERKYRKVVAVSQGVKRELMTYYDLPEDDIRVIPNGVDLDEFSPNGREALREQVRKELGVASDDFVLLFVANEFERKGLEFIIAAVRMLNRKNVKVLVVGEDNKAVFEKQAERLRASAQILFLGAAASMRDFHATSDVFILPTYYEAFSLASLEAAASGLPLLATRVNGTEELIVEGQNGFFIERDAENISEKVRMLLDDKAQRDALGCNARKSAEKYSWDAITQRTLEVYKQIQ